MASLYMTSLEYPHVALLAGKQSCTLPLQPPTSCVLAAADAES